MTALKNYIGKLNFMRSITKLTPLDIQKLSDSDIEYLKESIAADLSPENLQGDGEFGRTMIKEKIDYLAIVKAEVNDIAEKRLSSIFNTPAIDTHFDITSELKDWNATENGHDAPFKVSIRQSGVQGFDVSISSEGQPSLNVYFEINKGVPAMHITKDPCGDMDLHIHSGSDGYYICPENGENHFEKNNDSSLNFGANNALFLEAAEPDLDDDPHGSCSPS